MPTKIKSIEDYLEGFNEKFGGLDTSDWSVNLRENCEFGGMILFLQQAMESLVDSAPDEMDVRHNRQVIKNYPIAENILWKKQMKGES